MEDFENSAVLKKVLNDFVNLAERRFREAIVREGKVLSGELLNSIREGAIEEGQGFISAHVNFSEILRIKDMKSLNFTRTPPIQAMREYVEKVGISNFGTIPGYKFGDRPPTETEAIERVAWGLKMAKKTIPNVKRGYRGIYNDELKNYILPKFYDDMSKSTQAFALTQIRIMFND
jgi:hypothetical protein